MLHTILLISSRLEFGSPGFPLASILDPVCVCVCVCCLPVCPTPDPNRDSAGPANEGASESAVEGD